MLLRLPEILHLVRPGEGMMVKQVGADQRDAEWDSVGEVEGTDGYAPGLLDPGPGQVPEPAAADYDHQQPPSNYPFTPTSA
mgnify:CR=1 FL=1